MCVVLSDGAGLLEQSDVIWIVCKLLLGFVDT